MVVAELGEMTCDGKGTWYLRYTSNIRDVSAGQELAWLARVFVGLWWDVYLVYHEKNSCNNRNDDHMTRRHVSSVRQYIREMIHLETQQREA
jgi:hypothetical protein